MSRDHDHDANTWRHILPSVTRHMTMTQTHHANTLRHILPSVTRHTTHDTWHHIITLIDWDITPHIYPSFMLWTPPTHYFNFYFDRNSNLFSHTDGPHYTVIMYLLWALRDRIAFTLLRRHLFADFDFDFRDLFPPFLLLRGPQRSMTTGSRLVSLGTENHMW